MYWIKVCSEWDNEFHQLLISLQRLNLGSQWNEAQPSMCVCYNFMHTQQTIFAWSPLCTYHSLMHASIQPFAQSSMCMLQPHIYPAHNILHSLQCMPATASSMPRIQTFTFPSLETLNSAHSEGLTNRLSKSWWRAFVLTHPPHIHLLPVGSEAMDSCVPGSNFSSFT